MAAAPEDLVVLPTRSGGSRRWLVPLLVSEFGLARGDPRPKTQNQQEPAEKGERGEPVRAAHLGREETLAERSHLLSETVQEVRCAALISCSAV